MAKETSVTANLGWGPVAGAGRCLAAVLFPAQPVPPRFFQAFAAVRPPSTTLAKPKSV
jgi:hypothetical protein